MSEMKHRSLNANEKTIFVGKMKKFLGQEEAQEKVSVCYRITRGFTICSFVAKNGAAAPNIFAGVSRCSIKDKFRADRGKTLALVDAIDEYIHYKQK